MSGKQEQSDSQRINSTLRSGIYEKTNGTRSELHLYNGCLLCSLIFNRLLSCHFGIFALCIPK